MKPTNIVVTAAVKFMLKNSKKSDQTNDSEQRPNKEILSISLQPIHRYANSHSVKSNTLFRPAHKKINAKKVLSQLKNYHNKILI
jgi:hypothetical protein